MLKMALINNLLNHHSIFYFAIGDLMNEEAILEWVLGLHGSAHAVIESVDRRTLQALINEVDHLAVFFCKFSK
jgi:hypothetical protein